MKERKSPMRTCVGCGETKDKKDLIRVTYYEGNLSLDTTGKAKGRGAYICADAECLEKAFKKNGFKRSFRCNLNNEDCARLKEEMEKLLAEQ